MKWFSFTLAIFLISFSSIAAIAPITGVTSICLGLHTTLSDTTSGGTWSSSNTTVATISSTGGLFGAGVGTAIITYTIAAGFVTTQVTINSLPQVYPVVGGGTYCEGGNGVPVGISGSDPTNIYVLYSVDSSTATGPTYVGTGTALTVGYPTTSGVYTVYGINGAGCSTPMSGNVTIVVKPAPAPVLGNPIVCTGTITTLTDTTTGGTWSSVAPAIANVDASGIVTGVTAGTAIISYTLPTGCAATRSISVEAMAIPIVTYNSGAITFYATPGYTSYQWYDSSQGMIPGATAPSLAAFDSGFFYVVVTNSYGCKRASALFEFSMEELSIGSITPNNEVQLYPNPAQNELTITSPEKIKTITISNLSGQTVFNHSYNSANVHVHIQDLPTGVYFVKINGQQTTKLVKQ